MSQLVKIENDNTFTTTLIIAKGVELEHRAVMKLLDTHINDIKSLSPKTFEMSWQKRKGRAGRATRYANLSELQSTFLITLMRNSPKVIQFKKYLAIDFFKMRKALQKIATQQTNQQWIEQRDSGKVDRKLETDKIKSFVDYATKQGSKNAAKYYILISNMENKALFFIEQKYKNLRNVLNTSELSTIQNADHIVLKALIDGMNDKLFYKDIFKLAKKRVEMFAEIRGKSPLAHLAIEVKS